MWHHTLAEPYNLMQSMKQLAGKELVAIRCVRLQLYFSPQHLLQAQAHWKGKTTPVEFWSWICNGSGHASRTATHICRRSTLDENQNLPHGCQLWS